MINRYLIRYFLAVVDQGQFSRAAAEMSVSQPTLSVGIAKLERELGAKLFDRTNQRVVLTDAGRRLLSHARRIEQEFNLVSAAMGGNEPGRPIRIGMLSTIPAAQVEAIVAAHQRHGGADLFELIDAPERDLVRRLDLGRLDAAVGIERPDLQRFAPEHLRTEDYVLVLPGRHHLAGRGMIDPAELAGETMIVRRHCEVLGETSRYFVERSIRPHFAVRTTSDERAMAAVRAGVGVTVMPDSFEAKDIAQLHLAGFDLSRRIALLYAPHAQELRQRQDGIIRAIRTTLEAA